MPIEQLIRVGRARPIPRWGDPLLHTATEPVTDVGSELQLLLAGMFATNTAAHGAGVAAPHAGVSRAVLVYDRLDAEFRRHVGVVASPEVAEPEGHDRRTEVWAEGCLCLPGAVADRCPAAWPATR